MSFSSLTQVVKRSPNKNTMTNKTLNRFTPHCFVGQVTVTQGLNTFLPTSKGASCNYVIGYDGSIGGCVDEEDRSWCSSSRNNDEQAITFEIASDNKEPFTITDKALSALIDLMVDICKRYNKKRLIWISDKTKALAYSPDDDEILITVHRWFNPIKTCPGTYIMGKIPYIVEQVNDRLNTKAYYRVQVGAFGKRSNAEKLSKELKAEGYSTIFKYDTLWHVQIGAFSKKENAEKLAAELKQKGYSTFIKYE